MEYVAVNFKITGIDKNLILTASDLLVDAASAAGFESFETENDNVTGYIRKDIVTLPKEEKGCLVVLVNGYNVNSYYVNDEAPCFGATVYLKEKIVAETDDFVCYELTDMPRKTQRYSFQRPFTEIYKMEEDRKKFYLGGDLFPVREMATLHHDRIVLIREIEF